jgi:putative transposase
MVQLAANTRLASSRLLTPHDAYLALGPNNKERGVVYRELFRSELDPAQLDEIRSAANGGFALGNNQFRVQIPEMLKQRVERGAPGRPRKEKPELCEDRAQPN